MAAPAYNTKRPSLPCSSTKPPARPEFPGEGVALRVTCTLCFHRIHRDESIDLGAVLARSSNRLFACIKCLDELRAYWLAYRSL